MNPYRAAEYAVAVAVLLLIAAMLAAVAWMITITESWAGVGWAALIIAGFFAFAILHDEWENIGNWWCKKREAWDAKHPSASADPK